MTKIYSATKSDDGAWVIFGSIGTICFYGRDLMDSITEYMRRGGA